VILAASHKGIHSFVQGKVNQEFEGKGGAGTF